MSKRKQHPNKEIEVAVQYAESKGWHYKKPGKSAHAWGRLLCPMHTREGCSISTHNTWKCELSAFVLGRSFNVLQSQNLEISRYSCGFAQSER